MMTSNEKAQLKKLYAAHDKIRAAILGQPWQVRKDLEYKKGLIEAEIKRINSGISSRGTSSFSV